VLGRPDGSFGPEDRAIRATMGLWSFRAVAGNDVPDGAGEVVFSDVGAGTIRHDSLAWASLTDLMHVSADGAIRPNATMDRRAAVKMLWRLAGTPAAWEQTFAGAAVLATATGWWDTLAWDGAGDQLPDLTGGGRPLILRPGSIGGPTPLGYETDPRPYLFAPGWDDMIIDTPDAPTFPSGDFELRLDADLTRELATNESPHNFVFHKGGVDDDASLAVSFDEAGAPTVWYSVDGTSWSTISGAAPSMGTSAGRRGIRFVAGDGNGGHRLDVYEQAVDAPVEALELAFDNPAWQLDSTSVEPGIVQLHDSASEVALSSGHDHVPAGNLAVGWGRIRRMMLQTPTGTAFDLNPSVVPLPLSWTRSGPIPGEQPCWCMPDDQQGPAKDASFLDATGALWTIHNWQTGSTPIAFVDRPSVLLGSRAALATAPNTAFDPGPNGLSVVLGFRSTRAGISGSFLYSHRDPGDSYSTAGWGSLLTGYLCCGPAFGVSDGTALAFARSPEATDGVVTSAVGVLDPEAGVALAYTGGVPGAAVAIDPGTGSTTGPRRFTIGSDGSAQGYGGFEFFGAAVFRRALTPAEVSAIDTYLADPARQPGVAIPSPLRFG